MFNLWTLGGLSWRELIQRTWRESWADEVFGQAARLAFYHFLAIFPVLMLSLALLDRIPIGRDVLNTLMSSLASVFPPAVSGMISSVVKQMGDPGAHGSTWFAVLGSLWAAFNGTWAVMSGLNDAYEVSEERPWWKVTMVAAGLTAALAVLGSTALLMLAYGRHVFGEGGAAWQVVHWPVLALLLLVAFALYYRFGPNLAEMEWRWSTPGAVVAAILWIGATLLFRVYVHHSPGKYEQVYGSLASAAVLLLWFYVTGAAILIGGEINSEIENAAAQGGHPDARRPGERRPGGRPPARQE